MSEIRPEPSQHLLKPNLDLDNDIVEVGTTQERPELQPTRAPQNQDSSDDDSSVIVLSVSSGARVSLGTTVKHKDGTPNTRLSQRASVSRVTTDQKCGHTSERETPIGVLILKSSPAQREEKAADSFVHKEAPTVVTVYQDESVPKLSEDLETNDRKPNDSISKRASLGGASQKRPLQERRRIEDEPNLGSMVSDGNSSEGGARQRTSPGRKRNTPQRLHEEGLDFNEIAVRLESFRESHDALQGSEHDRSTDSDYQPPEQNNESEEDEYSPYFSDLEEQVQLSPRPKRKRGGQPPGRRNKPRLSDEWVGSAVEVPPRTVEGRRRRIPTNRYQPMEQVAVTRRPSSKVVYKDTSSEHESSDDDDEHSAYCLYE